ncbi:hypothetical protein DFH07DRAFT_85980 [Mycena maculata]|uniref:Uncharacterized protein n=1 Tax=Mycena maculata TaxID=230809 RepID=A0AAD7MYG9_9AGAR|nr:hypothetical protein DFH07DRAFT_85980 [Mycena maculata]
MQAASPQMKQIHVLKCLRFRVASDRPTRVSRDSRVEAGSGREVSLPTRAPTQLYRAHLGSCTFTSTHALARVRRSSLRKMKLSPQYSRVHRALALASSSSDGPRTPSRPQSRCPPSVCVRVHPSILWCRKIHRHDGLLRLTLLIPLCGMASLFFLALLLGCCVHRDVEIPSGMPA